MSVPPFALFPQSLAATFVLGSLHATGWGSAAEPECEPVPSSTHAFLRRDWTRSAMETAASEQAATLEAEAIRLAELAAVVERLAAAEPCDFSALRTALVALTDSGLSDRTLYDGEILLLTALDAMEVHSSDAVVFSAVLRVGAAFRRAKANFDTGYDAGLSLDRQFATLVGLMHNHHAVLSVQTDCFFALADYLSLGTEHTRVGARAGAFVASFIALREHGAALVFMAEPALNRIMLSATAFLSARHVPELNDFAATLHAVGLVLTHSKDAGAVKQALEVLSFCYCDGTEALLTMEPDNVKWLTSNDLLDWSLELCMANHVADRGVVLSLLNTLKSLAAISHHRLQDHPHAAEISLVISELIVRVMLANTGDGEVQELGCCGMYTLCFGRGFQRCPRQLNASSLKNAITAGAVVAVAAALRSHHTDVALFAAAARVLSFFFDSGAVDVAPFTDVVHSCVEALDRLVLVTEVTNSSATALANGSGLLADLFNRSPECRALGRLLGAAKTLTAVHSILEQRTDLPDSFKTTALNALQLLDPEESAKLQSSLPSAGAGRRSQPQHRSKAPLSASELAAATAAADAAAAKLLAEEEAAKAAKAAASTAQGSSLQRRRRKKHVGGASAEPDELDAATL